MTIFLALVEAPQTVEVPEQLVGPVYDVNDHLGRAASRCCTPSLPWLLP